MRWGERREVRRGEKATCITLGAGQEWEHAQTKKAPQLSHTTKMIRPMTHNVISSEHWECRQETPTARMCAGHHHARTGQTRSEQLESLKQPETISAQHHETRPRATLMHSCLPRMGCVHIDSESNVNITQRARTFGASRLIILAGGASDLISMMSFSAGMDDLSTWPLSGCRAA